MVNKSAATPTPKISTLLASSPPIVLDGALATYLETLGADISTALWSATLLQTNPSLIKKAHYDYFAAGANIAITSSYQASFRGLTQHLKISESEARSLVQKSVAWAQEARDEYAEEQTEGKTLFVAGSVGPYGAYLADGSEYRGDYVVGKEDMKDFHRGRVEALVDAGVDLLAMETIPSFSETVVLVELLEISASPYTEAWFSFTLKDKDHISDGTPLVDVVHVLERCKNVVAIGVNCVKEDIALSALKELNKLTKLPLIVYPNSGEDWNATERDWQGPRSGGDKLAELTKQYADAGAWMIGGCCRTTPDDVKVIAETLRKRSR